MKVLSALVASVFLALPLTAHASPHFESCHERTGSNATLILPSSAVDLAGAPMEEADELAVFTPDGVCAGWVRWEGSNSALAIWEDNPHTEAIEGFIPGEPMQYLVWDASEEIEYGQEVPLEVAYHTDFEDEGIFNPDAIYLVSSLVASSPVGNEAGAPVAFALTGNYPNPFTGRTTIGYELPQDAHVKLEVYNLLGHRVSVLVDEPRRAGRHEAQFEAREDIASGVYVYRLQTEGFAAHQKMVLVH